MNDGIDWHAQWKLHGFNFHSDHVHLDFQQLGLQKQPFWRKECIKLAPGPGFGDFSHPTTRLVLTMMHNLVLEEEVLDLGCGSGILSLSAVALGAKRAIGIDIEPDAVKHANENARINGFEKLCTSYTPGRSYKSTLLVMNMIRLEQKSAWDPQKYLRIKTAITSGILEEERSLYLEQTARWGWKLIKESHDSGWLGFQFLPCSFPE